MTPNQSHVAGLELAVSMLKDHRKQYGGVHLTALSDVETLLHMAQSAPAEPSREAVEVVCITQGGCNVTWTASKELTLAGTALMSVNQHNRIVAALTPPSPDAEMVELLRSKFLRIDPCKPVLLDEKAHCCEYTIYVERERLHRLIDAKLARLEVKP